MGIMYETEMVSTLFFICEKLEWGPLLKSITTVLLEPGLKVIAED